MSLRRGSAGRALRRETDHGLGDARHRPDHRLGLHAHRLHGRGEARVSAQREKHFVAVHRQAGDAVRTRKGISTVGSGDACERADNVFFTYHRRTLCWPRCSARRVARALLFGAVSRPVGSVADRRDPYCRRGLMLIFAGLSRRLARARKLLPNLLVPLQLLASLWVAACTLTPDAARAELPRLVIASEGARPPYNYFDGDHLAGFEIDLGTDLCRRMAVTCTFVAQDWDSMIDGLLAHRYNAVMAAMEITRERKQRIAFSAPYVRMPSAFLATKDGGITADSPEALAGKRIGVEKSGTHETFVLHRYPNSTLRRYTTLSDAILDLEAERVDAVIGDKDAIVTFLKTRRDALCCRILADVPRDPVFFGSGIGIGLRKEDVGLRAQFDQALSASMADGTFATISARYFDFPIN